MRWKKTLQLVDVHCEGEIGKVITGGVIDIPGKTMLDKMNYINEVDDSLRRLVVLEPRGCLQMSVNLLLPPTCPEAHAGFIVLQADKAHPMSGSNAICVVTALLELGMVPMQEPETTVVLDTPAGLVTARAACKDGRCIGVSLDMVPAFVERLDFGGADRGALLLDQRSLAQGVDSHPANRLGWTGGTELHAASSFSAGGSRNCAVISAMIETAISDGETAPIASPIGA